MRVTIKVTVCLENVFWIALFERVYHDELTAAKAIFGKEPTDPELYEWILQNYDQLKFSAPQQFKLIIKRKNPKRMLREVKKELEKSKSITKKESFAQEALRLDLEQRKKERASKSKEQKIAEEEQKFKASQEKKKKKKRGH